ncbi:MAG: hydroxyacid dehydrogenase [Oscillospiraceae bacterium]|nr:hydroxyacid dehydrogenase [Oscillospiraceae bacterium]
MNLLLTGALSYTEGQLDIFKSQFSVDFLKSENSIVDMPAKYDAIICNALFLYNSITKFANLKFVQLTSAGFDRIDLDYCKIRNIIVENAKGIYSIPMAEWVVLKALEIYKNTPFFIQSQKEKLWLKNRELSELNGKVATIVGFGSVGREVAKRLKAFGVYINAVDVDMIQTEYYDQRYCADKIMTPISQSDIIVLTLPLTKQTKHMFSDKLFNAMKTDVVLINVSRGAIIDEASLMRNINKFRGVALDVFEEEPLNEESPLWDMKNVIITPHNSFVSDCNTDRLYALINSNLNDFIKST